MLMYTYAKGGVFGSYKWSNIYIYIYPCGGNSAVMTKRTLFAAIEETHLAWEGTAANAGKHAANAGKHATNMGKHAAF